ncbi:tyrosine-type recombinase/integrase [Herbaspirillum rubrisubalbicans]|uniref:Alpha/beta hydrolase n=1 Tax=Herbaspirillum rubrisubalbicans TaxID=80842 RepID=A0ABX9BYT9_9BURK|nr:integrase arm-type DNA-binding domain-containing protein [Herbaspirillum rubrisubalbicans]RAM63114.1 alpha/beta hydrolase [Herbaspirillum rubrisubalbicans]
MYFDARAAKLLQPGQHLVVPDHPGLRLQATESTRTWVYRYKSPVDGRMRQVKIGSWPAMSVAAAIVRWEELKVERDAGVDLAVQRRDGRKQAQELADSMKESERLASLSVAEVCRFYLEGHIRVNRMDKGYREVKRTFDTMLGEFGDRAAISVSRRDAFAFLQQFLHIPVQGANLRRELGAAWSYSLDAGNLPDDTPNFWRDIMRGQFRSRGHQVRGEYRGTDKRVLSEAELALLIPWLPNFTGTNEDILTMYLWTCARGTEICQIHASEISEEGDGWWWTIPKAKTKNRRQGGATDHRIPLVGRALTIVKRRLQEPVNGYLFTGRKGEVWEQKNVGVAVHYHRPENESRPEAVRKRLPVSGWAPHDLRRTSRTLLAAMGCPEDIAEMILGHMLEGVRGVYNRHKYDKERREWLTRLSERLEQIAAGGDQAS